jgi:hypothetical protein
MLPRETTCLLLSLSRVSQVYCPRHDLLHLADAQGPSSQCKSLSNMPGSHRVSNLRISGPSLLKDSLMHQAALAQWLEPLHLC